MGFTTGGPRGVGVITSPFTPKADLSDVLAVVAERGGHLGGISESARDAVSGASLFEGLTCYNTTADTLEVYDGSGWVVVWANDATWASPSLTGSWVTFGGGLRGPSYRRRTGTVKLRGTVKSGGVGNANPIFTLPAGFRPSADEAFIVPANAGHADLRVDSAGRVYVAAFYNGGNNAIVSLSGIDFEV